MELTSNAVQTVNSGSNVLFTDTPISGNCSIIHRDGSGIVTLRGLSNRQCRARFRIFFNGNIAAVTSATAISMAIAIDGEPILATSMVSTPAAVSEYNNISSGIYVDVPTGCCSHISVKNTSTQSVTIENANLIIERVA